MGRSQNIIRKFLTALSASLLISLLLIITVANLIIYQGQPDSGLPTQDPTGYWGGNPGAGPDEKSPGNSISITEEYVHEKEACTLFVTAWNKKFPKPAHKELLKAAYDTLERPPQA